MKKRRFVSALTLILVVAALVWAAFKWTHPVSTGVLVIRCNQMPADDAPLTQWISTRPLVANSTITRANDTVTVTYKRNAADAGEFGDAVVAEARQIGYDIKGFSVSYNKNPFQ